MVSDLAESCAAVLARIADPNAPQQASLGRPSRLAPTAGSRVAPALADIALPPGAPDRVCNHTRSVTEDQSSAGVSSVYSASYLSGKVLTRLAHCSCVPRAPEPTVVALKHLPKIRRGLGED